MNTSTIFSRVNEIIDLVKPLSPAHDALKALAGDLEAQLRGEIANSKGVGNALKTVVKLLDGAKKDRRDTLAYPWIDGEGRQCVCNGFEAYRLRKHLPLPERPANIGDGIDLDRVFPDNVTGWRKLTMPNAKELREFIAVERAKYTGRKSNFGPLWDFGPNEPSVNALYLLNAATIFPNAAELFWISLVRPLYLTCEDGDAVVMPVRVKGKTQPPPANDAEREAHEALEAKQKQATEEDAERREIIRKAHDEYDEWHEKEKAAAAAALEAHKAVDNAPDEAAKAEALERYYDACESFAKAQIRRIHAWQIFHPEDAIKPEGFESIMKFLHARDYAKMNAA